MRNGSGDGVTIAVARGKARGAGSGDVVPCSARTSGVVRASAAAPSGSTTAATIRLVAAPVRLAVAALVPTGSFAVVVRGAVRPWG